MATVSGAIARKHFSGGREIGPVEAGLPEGWTLLSPIDLQCVKACGVTFALSAIERVIEERARGDAGQAAEIRGALEDKVGAGIRAVVPGSAEAAELKAALIDEGMWSQYLEVAIGPDAEVFSKSPVLSTVGAGRADRRAFGFGVEQSRARSGAGGAIRTGEVVGATLGNDVNLRDFEGRSALLLSKAKDNTASCAIGPFIRLFDERLHHRRRAQGQCRPDHRGARRLSPRRQQRHGPDQPRPARPGRADACREHHYPDGFVLFCGTLFAPTQDRDTPGGGFTHKIGDVVTIASRRLGTAGQHRHHLARCAAVGTWASAHSCATSLRAGSSRRFRN